MVKMNVDALVNELNEERNRQLFFIECSKKEIARLDKYPERRGYTERRTHYEQRINNKLDTIQKLTEAIKLIETLGKPF